MHSSDFLIDLKKPGLAVVLLLLSASLQAEPSDEVSTSEVTANEQQLSYDDNRGLPQRQSTSKEMIPPPPPGPYMSSALSDFSVKAPSFGRAYNKPVYRHDSSFIPMDVFSPDIPWPNNLRGNKNRNVDRWMPENGYRYVQPQPMRNNAAPGMKHKQGPANVKHRQARGMYPGQQYPGKNNMPNMNMNGSRWMPSMGYSPRGPYYNGPYNQPDSSNNHVARPAQPPYRAQKQRNNQSDPN